MPSEPTKDHKPKRGQPCPCGSGKLFEQCCEPLHLGKRPAATAEELMRARFTAHVAHNFKFLHDSFRGTAGKPYVAEEGEPAVTWTRLEVHAHEVMPDNADKAYVDFSAYGLEDGVEKVLHEKAEFLRIDGRWLYTREARLGPAPYKAAPKVGRNDPCPCGSGKKYKHCCLAKA